MGGHCSVFMGSSGEGDKRGILKAIRGRLIDEIDRDEVLLEQWTWAFGLGETTIEGLENATQTSDFAVLVMTADDVVQSREKSASAPRDNVVFELGLFMGALGRDRCLILSEDLPDKPELKLPSDLLGITTARFKWPGDEDAKAVALALQGPCHKVAERIDNLGPRFKPGKDSLAAQIAIRAFCESVEGAWWERITRDDVSALSFFTVKLDLMYNTVSLSGKSYDNKGKHVARWGSVLTRPEKDKNTILYHWEGWHADPSVKEGRFSGFGYMDFDDPSGGVIGTGSGRFWNVDESAPENTIVKPFDLRRVTDKEIIAKMTSGGDETKRAVVVETLEKWKLG
jgi:hypothetical protein